MKTFQRFLPLAFIILIFCGAFCFNNSEEVSVTPKGLAPDIVMKSHKGKKITLSKWGILYEKCIISNWCFVSNEYASAHCTNRDIRKF
jgi:hypothetical protein